MLPLADRVRHAVGPLSEVRPAPSPAIRDAAVLLLFDTRTPRLPLLFMERTEHLRHHAGQVAFPGGGAEPGDGGVAGTALREAAEEAGVVPEAVEVVGVLSPMVTATSDRWLTPVVGFQHTRLELRPDPYEVARLFWVELPVLMSAPHTVRVMERDGHAREVHFYDVGGTIIWGATGAIVHELLTRLGGRMVSGSEGG